MRKLLFILTLSLTGTASSQYQTGSKVVDVNFNYFKFAITQDFAAFNYSPYDYTSRNYSINPLIGFILNENSIFYTGVSIKSNKRVNDYLNFVDDEYVTTKRIEVENLYSLEFGFEKNYLIANKIFFSPTLEGSFGIGKKKYEVDSDEIKNNLVYFSLSLNPKIQYFLNEKWSLMAAMGYVGYERKIEILDLDLDDNPKNVDENIRANFGLNTFTLGIRYFLNNSSE